MRFMGSLSVSKGTSLLVGNGINYFSKNTISWPELLEQLAKEVSQEQILDDIDFKPFTLVFEEINFRNRQLKEFEIKEKVAELVSKIQGGDIHHRLIDGRQYKHIFTTNYDTSIEDAAESDYTRVGRETKYSLFRKNEVSEKYVWHIHGEKNVPNSIMLGHEHYAGQLQTLRTYITSDRPKSSAASPRNPVSPFKAGKTDFESDGTHHSWMDIFLRDDVHIVGLGMDYTEIDLWWVLAYKEKLRKVGKHKVGTTTFHARSEKFVESKVEEYRGRLAILESFGVDVKRYQSHSEIYDAVIPPVR